MQQRDERILRLIYEQGFLITEHVQSFFTSYSEARRRVGELKRAGLVIEQASEAVTHFKLLRLTKAGRYAAEAATPYRLPQRPVIAPHRFQHDVKLTHLRITVEEKYDVPWIPEVALRREYRDPPDGAVVFTCGKRIVFELENSLKGKDRFLGKLAREQIPAILVVYVASDDYLFKALKRYLTCPRASHSSAGLTTLKAIQAGNGEMWGVRDQELSIFHFRDL